MVEITQDNENLKGNLPKPIWTMIKVREQKYMHEV